MIYYGDILNKVFIVYQHFRMLADFVSAVFADLLWVKYTIHVNNMQLDIFLVSSSCK